jgi:hypothetical protein
VNCMEILLVLSSRQRRYLLNITLTTTRIPLPHVNRIKGNCI